MNNARAAAGTPVIPWPAWQKPFHSTPRGYIVWKYTTRIGIYAFLGLLLAGLPIALIGFPRFAPFVLVLWPAVYFWLVYPVRKVVAEARQHCEPWREQWLRFEEKSVAFQADLRSHDFRSDEAIDQAPTPPPVVWKLSHYVARPLTDYAMSSDQPDPVRLTIVRQALSRMLCELARIGGRVVVGKEPDGWAVYGIFLIAKEVQFWTKFSFSQHGDVICPELMMGVQQWAGAFTDKNHGRKYVGDLAKIKRVEFRSSLVLLVFAIPIVGWAILLIATLKFWPDLFATDHAVALRSKLFPISGDSADARILVEEKDKIPGSNDWTTLLPETELKIEAMKGHVLNAALEALSLRR